MKQVIGRASLFVLQLACIVTLSASGSIRDFLYRHLYPLVPVDAYDLAASPDALRSRGYSQDDPSELAAFQSMARSAVQNAATDGQRLQMLGAMLYKFRRPNAPLIQGGRELGVQTILGRIEDGEHGLCGHTTLVLAALWRSLGRDFREIRFTTSDEAAWFAAHYGIEVYAPDTGRWFYYDVGLNGYALDEQGEPMSLLELDEHLANGRDVAIVADTAHQDWDTATFMSFLRQHQQQVFSLNNELRTLDADRRFGRLNFAYPLLSKLPQPLDRVVDALTGDAAPRLVLSKRPPPPSDRATLHLTASSPIG
jgi:hypothetical protein